MSSTGITHGASSVTCTLLFKCNQDGFLYQWIISVAFLLTLAKIINVFNGDHPWRFLGNLYTSVQMQSGRFPLSMDYLGCLSSDLGENHQCLQRGSPMALPR